MAQRSVSTVDIVLEIDDTQFIKCELKRHLSPKTVGKITRALPLRGNAHFLGKSAVYFETSIESGTERTKNIFKKGDIAFLPVGKMICFFYSDTKVGKALTPIGRMIDNVEKLSDIKSGSELQFYLETGA
tara:strand:+ start:195 stop:584 length:390 start_codon:yes stop_codon:yes gene_type:complete